MPNASRAGIDRLAGDELEEVAAKAVAAVCDHVRPRERGQGEPSTTTTRCGVRAVGCGDLHRAGKIANLAGVGDVVEGRRSGIDDDEAHGPTIGNRHGTCDWGCLRGSLREADLLDGTHRRAIASEQAPARRKWSALLRSAYKMVSPSRHPLQHSVRTARCTSHQNCTSAMHQSGGPLVADHQSVLRDQRSRPRCSSCERTARCPGSAVHGGVTEQPAGELPHLRDRPCSRGYSRAARPWGSSVQTPWEIGDPRIPSRCRAREHDDARTGHSARTSSASSEVGVDCRLGPRTICSAAFGLPGGTDIAAVTVEVSSLRPRPSVCAITSLICGGWDRP